MSSPFDFIVDPINHIIKDAQPQKEVIPPMSQALDFTTDLENKSIPIKMDSSSTKGSVIPIGTWGHPGFISNVSLRLIGNKTPRFWVQVQNVDQRSGNHIQDILNGYISYPTNLDPIALQSKSSFYVEQGQGIQVRWFNLTGINTIAVLSFTWSKFPIGSGGQDGDIFDGTPKVHYQYEGTVTQLAATSEVANIGFQFQGQVGSLIRVNEVRLVMSNQGAGRAAEIAGLLSNSAYLSVQTVALDNQSMYYAPTVAPQEQAVIGNPDTNPRIWEICSDQILRLRATVTIDALTTIIAYVKYTSLHLPFTVTAIGAGISISSETHKIV